jgi:hypothetical protein
VVVCSWSEVLLSDLAGGQPFHNLPSKQHGTGTEFDALTTLDYGYCFWPDACALMMARLKESAGCT